MKSWWKSKTLWVNVLALIGLGVQSQTGFAIDPALQGGILGVVNVILRALTGESLTT